MRKLLIFLALLNSMLYAAGQASLLTDSSYTVRDSVMIKTRDGAYISAIIAFKKSNKKPLPAILFYTTYNEGPRDAYFALKPAEKNYVGVVAYCRGIKTNGKDYTPFIHDADDAYDVIDWISKQPWCNGKVGMYGGSYTGFVQWAVAKKNHPALKTIVPQVAVMPGFDFPMENNIATSNILSWPNDNIYKDKRLPPNLPFTWYESGVSYRSLDSLANAPDPIFQTWLLHPGYDTYWSSLAPTPKEYAAMNIPILATTGYYDGAQIGAMQYIRKYYQYNTHPQLYVAIGPYDHWSGQRNAADTLMGYAIDSVARISMMNLAFEWLDHVLKDAPMPALLKNKFNYEIMDANKWQHAGSPDKWSKKIYKLYLSVQKNNGYYSLLNKKPATQNFVQQEVNFKDRSDTGQNNYFTPTIVNKQLPIGNGIVFATRALDEPMLISGHFFGRLFTCINKKDMDITVSFYEKTLEGNFFYLTTYAGRASYAANNNKRTLLQPGVIKAIDFNTTRFVSKRLAKGSCLVIVVNVNKHPFNIINYGSGKNVYDETIQDASEPLKIKWMEQSWIAIGKE